MFFKKSILAVVSLLALASTEVVAKPVPANEAAMTKRSVSFNNFLNFQNMANFDDFFGVDNFNGFFNQQQFIQQPLLVCQSLPVNIIQQRLAVLSELAKQVILTQVCEVEVQTIVLQQFNAGFDVFNLDLNRLSGHQLGFDQFIAGHFNQFFDVNGLLSTHDFGFNGFDIGNQFALVDGFNWNDFSSPSSVGNAFDLASSVSNLGFSS